MLFGRRFQIGDFSKRDRESGSARKTDPNLSVTTFETVAYRAFGGRFFKNATVKQMSLLVLKTGPNEQVSVLTGSFV